MDIMIEVLRTAAEIRARVAGLRREGRTLALVPTMGFLHEGHLSLMREGRRRADVCAASIFVNPTQFGPTEDLSRYPRDEEGDLRKCESAGVSLVWAPQTSEVYPPGYQSFVEVEKLQARWCGQMRPGHFRGVATVVAKLFNVFTPDLAFFGEKDFQQLAVIKRMVRDLSMPVEVVGLPIVRERDGLAMSSRNSYLSAPERARALGLSRALAAARHLKTNGESRAAVLTDAALAELKGVEARVDYVAVVDSETLEPIQTVQGASRMLIAAFIGRTRLIDNSAL
jgi:pantoate--beta-alanine ligase